MFLNYPKLSNQNTLLGTNLSNLLSPEACHEVFIMNSKPSDAMEQALYRLQHQVTNVHTDQTDNG